MTPSWPALLGGMMLGLSVSLLLLLNGRVAGISGILGRLIGGQRLGPNALFVTGLLLGPLLYRAAYGAFPALTLTASWPVILTAGLLVGIGTRMGSGCASGHGILGLARFSRRSMVATSIFLAVGILTATLTGLLR